MSIEVIATIVGAVGTVIPLLMKSFEGSVATTSTESQRSGESVFKTRMSQVSAKIKHQVYLVHLNWWASNLLRFSQYVIGGVLATAFVRDNLSPNNVGLLGVLVLMASLIHQHFRPDTTLQECRFRVFRLRRTLRRVEDEYAAATNSGDGSKTEAYFAAILSRALNENDRLDAIETRVAGAEDDEA